MKTTFGIAMVLATAFSAGAADDPAVTFVAHDTVAKGGAIATAPNLAVLVAHRAEAGQVELHDKETDTFYVLAGSATLVTGGTMEGGTVTAPGQQRGTAIQGGDARQLTKGDVIVIPAGVPHWFKEVPQSIDYYVVKVIAP